MNFIEIFRIFTTSFQHGVVLWIRHFNKVERKLLDLDTRGYDRICNGKNIFLRYCDFCKQESYFAFMNYDFFIRDGLGNGLYCDDLSIGGFKHDQVSIWNVYTLVMPCVLPKFSNTTCICDLFKYYCIKISLYISIYLFGPLGLFEHDFDFFHIQLQIF